jgi:hypothetical protein
MSTKAEVVIVLRAAVTLRGLQEALRKVQRGSPEHARLYAAVRIMEQQFDDALGVVADEILIEPYAGAVA